MFSSAREVNLKWLFEYHDGNDLVYCVGYFSNDFLKIDMSNKNILYIRKRREYLRIHYHKGRKYEIKNFFHFKFEERFYSSIHSPHTHTRTFDVNAFWGIATVPTSVLEAKMKEKIK